MSARRRVPPGALRRASELHHARALAHFAQTWAGLRPGKGGRPGRRGHGPYRQGHRGARGPDEGAGSDGGRNVQGDSPGEVGSAPISTSGASTQVVRHITEVGSGGWWLSTSPGECRGLSSYPWLILPLPSVEWSLSGERGRSTLYPHTSTRTQTGAERTPAWARERTAES